MFMTNGMKNLSKLGLRKLLEHRARCLDQSREIRADASGDWRLLKGDEQKRVEELLDEAQRSTVELERRRRQWAQDVTDPAQLVEAMQRQAGDLYLRSSY
jgi:hypothetical protein